MINLSLCDVHCYSCYEESCPKPWNPSEVDQIISPDGWCLVSFLFLKSIRNNRVVCRHLAEIIKVMIIFMHEIGQQMINAKKINVHGS